METYKLYNSVRKDKKYTVYVPKGDKSIKVSYGAAGMSDYTIHKDKERRELYRARHAKDNINDPYSAGFWSWHHLWGVSSDSTTAFRSAVRIAKNILN